MPHRQLVDDAAAEAEADGAELAGAVRARFQPHRGGEEIFPHLAAVDLAEQLRALLFVARIAADRGQPVRRESDEIGDRQPPRHIFDIGIEAAVFVDDQNAGSFRRVRRPHEIALDAAVALRRRHRDGLAP